MPRGQHTCQRCLLMGLWPAWQPPGASHADPCLSVTAMAWSLPDAALCWPVSLVMMLSLHFLHAHADTMVLVSRPRVAPWPCKSSFSDVSAPGSCLWISMVWHLRLGAERATACVCPSPSASPATPTCPLSLSRGMVVAQAPPLPAGTGVVQAAVPRYLETASRCVCCVTCVWGHTLLPSVPRVCGCAFPSASGSSRNW